MFCVSRVANVILESEQARAVLRYVNVPDEFQSLIITNGARERVRVNGARVHIDSFSTKRNYGYAYERCFRVGRIFFYQSHRHTFIRFSTAND